MPTILIVDDEPRIVELARDYLEHAGFEVVTAGDGTAGLATARDLRPDLVVLDLGLPGNGRTGRDARAASGIGDPDRDADGEGRRAGPGARP